MIFCFDLDGTLCRTSDMAYGEAIPHRERIRYVNHLYKEGHRIVIDTARGSGSTGEYRTLTELQLRKWGVLYHTLRTGQKPVADIYVDDRGESADRFFGS